MNSHCELNKKKLGGNVNKTNGNVTSQSFGDSLISIKSQPMKSSEMDQSVSAPGNKGKVISGVAEKIGGNVKPSTNSNRVSSILTNQPLGVIGIKPSQSFADALISTKGQPMKSSKMDPSVAAPKRSVPAGVAEKIRGNTKPSTNPNRVSSILTNQPLGVIGIKPSHSFGDALISTKGQPMKSSEIDRSVAAPKRSVPSGVAEKIRGNVKPSTNSNRVSSILTNQPLGVIGIESFADQLRSIKDIVMRAHERDSSVAAADTKGSTSSGAAQKIGGNVKPSVPQKKVRKPAKQAKKRRSRWDDWDSEMEEEETEEEKPWEDESDSSVNEEPDDDEPKVPLDSAKCEITRVATISPTEATILAPFTEISKLVRGYKVSSSGAELAGWTWKLSIMKWINDGIIFSLDMEKKKRKGKPTAWLCPVITELRMFNRQSGLIETVSRKSMFHKDMLSASIGTLKQKGEVNKFVKDDAMEVAVGFRVYPTSHEQIKELSIRVKFVDISKLTEEEVFSEPKVVGGVAWRISVNQDEIGQFTFELYGEKENDVMWWAPVIAELRLFNQNSGEVKPIDKETFVNQEGHRSKIIAIIQSMDMYDDKNGYVRNDSIFVDILLKSGFSSAMASTENGEDADGSSSGFIRLDVNVQTLTSNGVFSPAIEVRRSPWKLWVCTDSSSPPVFLEMYLYHRKSDSNRWSIDVSCEFKILNIDPGKNFIETTEKTFNHEIVNWGFDQFINLDEVTNEEMGFSKDGKITVEVRFTLSNIMGIRVPPRIDFTDSNKPYHDITLVIEGEKLYASKQILAANSPVFEAMFYGDFVEKKKKEIELKDINRKEFIGLLNLFYPTDEKITDANAESLLQLADRFQMPTVLDQVEQFLIGSSTLDVPSKLKLSDQFILIKLQEHCLDTFKTAKDVLDLHASDCYKSLSDKAKVMLLDKAMKLNSEA